MNDSALSDRAEPLDEGTARILACWAWSALGCEDPACPVCGAGTNTAGESLETA